MPKYGKLNITYFVKLVRVVQAAYDLCYTTQLQVLV